MKIGISRPPTPPYPLPDVDAAIVARHAERVAVSLPTVTNEPEVRNALERIAERVLR